MKKFRFMFVLSAFALMLGLTATTNFVTAAPQNTGEIVIDSNENQPRADEEWNTFTNEKGGYSFKYPPVWNAAVNPINEKETIFGPEATIEAGLGGVQTRTQEGTLKEFVDWMEQDVSDFDTQFLSREDIMVNEVPGILIQYAGEFNGFAVALQKDNQFFVLFMHNTEPENIDLFEELVGSFTILN